MEGCADLKHLWGTTLHTHNLFSRPFFQPQSVYIRFTHSGNLQPKFYIGSAMHHTLDREYSRSCKYLQLANERFKPSWHSATGRTMTTCIFGPPSQYTQAEQTIAVLKWPSSKSGNPDSTFHSFVNFPSKKGHPQETSPQHERPVRPGHLMASCQTQVHSETCSPNPDLHTVPKPSGTLDHHPCLRFKYKGKV